MTQAITSVVLAALTACSLVALVVYVIKTAQIASATAASAKATEESARATERAAATSEQVLAEMQAAREVETAPQVVCYFDIPAGTHLVYIVVKNIGRSPARAVHIEFSPPLGPAKSDRNPLDLPLFLTQGIPYLPPDYELRSLMWSAVEALNQENGVPQTYDAVVAYTGPKGEPPYRETYQLDLRIFYGRTWVDETDLDDIHAVLKNIATPADKLADSLGAIERLLTSEGVQLSNGSLLIHQIPAGEGAALAHRKLGEVYRAWKTWSAMDENARALSATQLQRRLRVLRSQLLAIDPSDDETVAEQTSRVTSLLTELAAVRFYLDRGRSLRQFADLAKGLSSIKEDSGHGETPDD